MAAAQTDTRTIEFLYYPLLPNTTIHLRAIDVDIGRLSPAARSLAKAIRTHERMPGVMIRDADEFRRTLPADLRDCDPAELPSDVYQDMIRYDDAMWFLIGKVLASPTEVYPLLEELAETIEKCERVAIGERT